ncbi:MAG: hypothetical protein ABIR50_04450 [Ginsengibacter sp.]
MKRLFFGIRHSLIMDDMESRCLTAYSEYTCKQDCMDMKVEW